MRLSNCRVVATAAVLMLSAPSSNAYAFGGFWSPAGAAVRQTATQVIFVDNPDSTITALVRVHYNGPADAFAWVIPIPGTPTVGVTSSAVFERLDAATAPEYWLEYNLADSCKHDSGGAAVPALPPDDAATDPIAVLAQGSVGPYDHVTIAVDAAAVDPARAATDWLGSNGFALGEIDRDILGRYLRDGLHLLAFKLTKDSDAGAIKPVVLTYESERPMIPLRPTAVAAQDEVGIQVWVIGASHAVPSNYHSLVLNDARIDWLSGERFRAGTLPSGGAGPFGPAILKPGNYDAIVSQATREAGGRGFVTELAAPASQFRDKIWSEVDEQQFMLTSTQTYEDGLDAVITATSTYVGWDGLKEAIEGSVTLPEGVTVEAFSRDPSAHRGKARVDTARFLELLGAKVIRPVSEAAALLYAAPYLTRFYSVMRPAEMTEDPAFDYNFDLGQVGSVHIARQFLECAAPADLANASWRIELPQGGVVVGRGERDWPVAEDALPANLKIVHLSTAGSGTIVEDNSRDIGTKLLDAAGTTGSKTALPPPSIGLTIGGTQRVSTRDEPFQEPAEPKPASRSGCGVASTGAVDAGSPGSSRAAWLLPFALWLIARRRASCKRVRARASVARGAFES